MMETVSISVWAIAIVVVVVVVVFIVTVGIVAYSTSRGVNRANQEFYSRREDASNVKITKLETKVQMMETRIDELTTQLLRRYDGPKESAVAG